MPNSLNKKENREKNQALGDARRLAMASTTTEKRKCTYKDYLKTPDDERYELIGGELLMTPSPGNRDPIREHRLPGPYPEKETLFKVRCKRILDGDPR